MREKGLEKAIRQRVSTALGSVRLETLLTLQNGVCAYDLEPIYISTENNSHKYRQATIDHVHPKCKGGRDNPANLVAASYRQNIDKRDNLPRGRWRPNFQHTGRQYREARSQVLERRRFIVDLIVAMVHDGEIARETTFMLHDMSRIIRREYSSLSGMYPT